MKTSLIKRNLLIMGLGLLACLWLVPTVFAAPPADAVVPTATHTPTPTVTPSPTLIPTAFPGPSDTPAPTATPLNLQMGSIEGTQTQEALAAGNNVPETTDTSAAAAGSSVLGFFLCVGVILVVGLAALNIWARRRP